MPLYDDKRFAPPAPLAEVILRDPISGVTLGSVAMLLDSGADVTVLPRYAVNQLGVELNPGQGYEVTGFDGKPIALAAVQLDLLFLKRAFQGRFLIIDQGWGIVGRDILNHLTIVLDGPRLTWSEQQSRPGIVVPAVRASKKKRRRQQVPGVHAYIQPPRVGRNGPRPPASPFLGNLGPVETGRTAEKKPAPFFFSG